MKDRIAWHIERKTYIGGSDIGAIIGVSTFNTALDIYLQKTSDSIKEIENASTKWGHILEPVVATEYSESTNIDLEESKNVIRHPKYNFIAANIDRWANNKQYILECKTADSTQKEKWGVVGTDQIPLTYKYQVAYYAAITGVEKVDIAVLIGGNDFRIYKYKQDLELQDKLIKAACYFWHHHIEKRIAPEATTLSDTDKLYSKSNGRSIEASGDLIEKVDNLKDLKAQERFICSKMNDLKFDIKKYMQSNEVLIDDLGQVKATWKETNSRSSLDIKKLQEEHKGIYEQYLITKNGSRMFLIK